MTLFFRANFDVFAWSTAEMPGILPSVISHSLSVNLLVQPIKQKKRKLGPERLIAVKQEIAKLQKADFIREVHYPDWLSNVVMVKKASGKWRMCINFIDLNRACPKDNFSLPSIDRLVDASVGHYVLSFMDAFSRYNQIMMDPSDQEKTAFITEEGLYCYKVMPFGLKNASATYQRLVNKVFADKIDRSMEIYVDDMLVKNSTTKQHIKDLVDTFASLRLYNMRLNPKKCTFGVEAGKFLGFMVFQRGIKINPEKIQAILEMTSPKMTSPKSVKDIQRLAGRMAALNRFISRSADKCLPFFKLLRNSTRFV